MADYYRQIFEGGKKITSRYLGVAGQGSPNSPELISILQDWLPSHLESVVVRMVMVARLVGMVMMVRTTMMTRKWWGSEPVLVSYVDWQSIENGGGCAEKNFRAELSCLSFPPKPTG